MGIIISLLIMWLMFKILQWAFSSLSDSNNDKETSNHDNGAIDSNSNEEPSNHDVGTIDSSNDKETANHNVGAIDDKPSDLKYKNEVYISLRNKLQKAYEGYKKSGVDIEWDSWDSNIDGFLIYENDSPSVDDLIYSVEVHYDDQNLVGLNVGLNNPFYIVKYGIFFDRRDHDDYIEKANYLNNSEKRNPAIYYTANIIKNSNLGVYYANLIVVNNKRICEDAEKLGEVVVFDQLILEAIKAFLKGEEIYGDGIRNENSSHDVGAIDGNSDKENYIQTVEAIDDKPSDLKYNNEVYISFINKVQKAYESFKKSGYNIEWDSDRNGFSIFERGSLPTDSLTYTVDVHYDDQNRFELNDPFYIFVKYGIIFERSDYDDYKEKAEYLNNRETKIPEIFYTASIVEDSNFGVYYTNLLICNYKVLCEDMEKLGEAGAFEALFSWVGKVYDEGEKIYGDRIRNAKNYSN